MSRQQIQHGELNVGTPLDMDVYDQRGTLLLRRGQVIRNEHQLERLLEIGMFVDAGSGSASGSGAGHEADGGTTIRLPTAPLARLVAARRRLAGLYASASERNIRGDLEEVAGEIALACRANADLCLGVIVLDDEGDYAPRHAIDTAVVCEVIAQALEWDDRRRASLRAAALSMNLSLVRLHNVLHQQRRPLNAAQLTQIREHPARSAQMLETMGVDDTLWLDAVRHHHESSDGSGYPAGLEGESVPEAALLLAMADAYCARVRVRGDRAAQRPDNVMRSLYRAHQGHSAVEMLLAQTFVKTLGCYPPGTLVRLANGDLALVTQRGASANQPVVSTVVGISGFPLMIPIRRKPGEAKFAVEGAVEGERLPSLPSLRALWGHDASLD